MASWPGRSAGEVASEILGCRKIFLSEICVQKCGTGAETSPSFSFWRNLGSELKFWAPVISGVGNLQCPSENCNLKFLPRLLFNRWRRWTTRLTVADHHHQQQQGDCVRRLLTPVTGRLLTLPRPLLRHQRHHHVDEGHHQLVRRRLPLTSFVETSLRC